MTASRRSFLLAAASWWMSGVPFARRAEAQVVRVAGVEALVAAVARAEPGTVISVAAGFHVRDEPLVIERSGIVVEGEPGAELAIPITVAAPGVVLSRLAIRNRPVRVRADDVSIGRCRFRGYSGPLGMVHLRGRVAGFVCSRCEFSDTDPDSMECYGINFERLKEGSGPLLIEFCHFHDFAFSPGGKHRNSAIRLGEGQGQAHVSLRAEVRYCLFERVQGTETIQVKSSDNHLHHLTFLDLFDSRGRPRRPTNRFGKRNRWEVLWIERAFGIVVRDRGNRLVNVHCIDCSDGIVLPAGSATGDYPPDPTPPQVHPAAENTHVANCRGALWIGHQINRRHRVPASGTRVFSHDGPVIPGPFEVDTRIGEEPVDPVEIPPRLTPADVGPES